LERGSFRFLFSSLCSSFVFIFYFIQKTKIKKLQSFVFILFKNQKITIRFPLMENPSVPSQDGPAKKNRCSNSKCSQKFIRLSDLNLHLNVHKQIYAYPVGQPGEGWFFATVSAAAQHLSISTQAISRVLRKKQSEASGYYFTAIDPPESEEDAQTNSAKTKLSNKRKAEESPPASPKKKKHKTTTDDYDDDKRIDGPFYFALKDDFHLRTLQSALQCMLKFDENLYEARFVKKKADGDDVLFQASLRQKSAVNPLIETLTHSLSTHQWQDKRNYQNCEYEIQITKTIKK